MPNNDTTFLFAVAKLGGEAKRWRNNRVILDCYRCRALKKEKRDRPEGQARNAGQKKSWRRPTLARAGPALPSAMEPLTSVFGMGTGMAAPPWSPAKSRRAGD